VLYYIRREKNIRRKITLKKFVGIIIGVIFFLIYTGIGNIETSDVSVDSYIAHITINDAGDMRVVEEWNMDYHETMTVRFRDIVYDKYADGYPLYMEASNTASIDTSDVVVKYYRDGVDRSDRISVGYSWDGDRDELGQIITCEPRVDYCESIFVNTLLAGRMSGEVKFVYEYTIEGAITQYSDISELNWRLFTYAEGKVKHAEIDVTFPDNTFDKSNVYVWGHGLTDGTISIVSNNRVEMEMSNIKDGEFPEFRILTENSLYPNIRPKNTIINDSINKSVIMDYERELSDEYNRRITIANILLYSSFGLVVIMIGIGLIVYRNGDYYRELPSEDTPATLSYLYFMEKIVDETITATLLDLIRRKHITLDYSGTDMSSSLSSFTLVLNDKPEDKLKEYESYFMSYIFSTIGDGKKVTTKEIEGYGSISESKAKSFQSFLKAFSLSAKKEARSKKYFESGMENNKKAILLANIVPIVFIGIALMLYATYNISILVPVLIAVAAMILYSVYVNSIKKRSIEGNELYAKWKAFRNFLTSFGNMEDYPIPGIIVWEHYLVYATILGVADQVMKQLRVKIVETDIDESQTTYFTRGFYRNRYWGIHHSFSSSFRVAKMNAQSKIVEARNARSSSGGFGGGFGGGSSFGGGGGGGRSR
jgi:uncharacterized membrane protein